MRTCTFKFCNQNIKTMQYTPVIKEAANYNTKFSVLLSIHASTHLRRLVVHTATGMRVVIIVVQFITFLCRVKKISQIIFLKKINLFCTCLLFSDRPGMQKPILQLDLLFYVMVLNTMTASVLCIICSIKYS